MNNSILQLLICTHVNYALTFSQNPNDTTDTGEAREMAVMLNVQNWSGTGTMSVKLAQGVRNRDADFVNLTSWTVTGNLTTTTYLRDFARFWRAKIENVSGTAEADFEILGDPKR